MKNTNHSLDNNSLSLWPKASDHESAAEVGWLLHSTWQQDETSVSEMIPLPAGEKIGVKWCPIRTTVGYNRKKDEQDETSVSEMIPYLWDSHDPWYMSAFSNEAYFDTNPHGGIIKCGWCSWPMNTKFLIS